MIPRRQSKRARLATHWPRTIGHVRVYVALATLRAFTITAIALTCLFSLLEFVEQLASVGQGEYRVSNAFIYVALTTPARFLQVAPISMLLGALLGLGALARNSELNAMLSLGIPESQIITSVLTTTLPVTAVLFLLAQFVIPAALQSAYAERSAALHLSANYGDNSFWAQSGRQYLNVGRFGPGDVPTGIDIYMFEADNSLSSLVHAEQAHVERDGTWMLSGVSRKHVEQSIIKTEHLPTFPWRSFLSPVQMRLLNLPLDSIPPVSLYHHISSLKQMHQDATRYEEEFWMRVSIPFSMVAMIMIVSPFLFGAARLQSTGRTLTFGVGFGIVFSLVQQILNHLGLLLNLSPAIVALTPPLAVTGLALYLLWPSRSPALPSREPDSVHAVLRRA